MAYTVEALARSSGTYRLDTGGEEARSCNKGQSRSPGEKKDGTERKREHEDLLAKIIGESPQRCMTLPEIYKRLKACTTPSGSDSSLPTSLEQTLSASSQFMKLPPNLGSNEPLWMLASCPGVYRVSPSNEPKNKKHIYPHSVVKRSSGDSNDDDPTFIESESNFLPHECLITVAIMQAPQRRLTVSDILDYYRTHCKQFKIIQEDWQSAVVRTLLTSNRFVEIPADSYESCSYWRLDPLHEHMMEKPHIYKRKMTPGGLPPHTEVHVVPGSDSECEIEVDDNEPQVTPLNTSTSPLELSTNITTSVDETDLKTTPTTKPSTPRKRGRPRKKRAERTSFTDTWELPLLLPEEGENRSPPKTTHIEIITESDAPVSDSSSPGVLTVELLPAAVASGNDSSSLSKSHAALMGCKRGRPRKRRSQLSVPAEQRLPAVADPERKRGRPLKVRLPPHNLEESPPAKRKRGRPRKMCVPATTLTIAAAATKVEEGRDSVNMTHIQRITEAIMQSPKRRMTLAQIFAYYMRNFQQFKEREKACRKVIRWTLSDSKCFVLVEREGGARRGFWALDPEYEKLLVSSQIVPEALSVTVESQHRRRGRPSKKLISASLSHQQASKTSEQVSTDQSPQVGPTGNQISCTEPVEKELTADVKIKQEVQDEETEGETIAAVPDELDTDTPPNDNSAVSEDADRWGVVIKEEADLEAAEAHLEEPNPESQNYQQLEQE